jgi:hypothetical protein
MDGREREARRPDSSDPKRAVGTLAVVEPEAHESEVLHAPWEVLSVLEDLVDQDPVKRVAHCLSSSLPACPHHIIVIRWRQGLLLALAAQMLPPAHRSVPLPWRTAPPKSSPRPDGR